MRKRNTSGRLNRKDDTAFQLNEIEDILRRVDAMSLLDTRSEDDILGYGEQSKATIVSGV
jgi:hypothetical protein